MCNLHNENGDCWGSEAKKRRIVCCLFYFRAGVTKMQAERSQQKTQRTIQRTSKYIQNFIKNAEKKREKAQGT